MKTKNTSKSHILILAIVPVCMLFLGIEGILDGNSSAKLESNFPHKNSSNFQITGDERIEYDSVMQESLHNIESERDHFLSAYTSMNEANTAFSELILWLGILQFIAIAHVSLKSRRWQGGNNKA